MAKKGGNPQEFVKHEESLVSKPISVKFQRRVYEYLQELPDKAEWLRQAAAEKLERDQQEKATA